MRADRLLSLVLLLQARGETTAGALAAELEVSVRTVYRDLEALAAAGVPVLARSGPGGGCRLMDGYRFPLRGLRPDEAEALLILGVPSALRELGLDQLLDAAHRQIRLSAGLGEAAAGPGSDGPGAALVHLDMPRWFSGAAEEVPCLRDLARALRAGRRLALTYERAGAGVSGGGSGGGEFRVVGPLGLVNKAGTWYLVAAPTEAGQARVGGAVAGAVAGAVGGDPAEAGQAGMTGGEPADAGDRAAARAIRVFRAGRITSVRVLAEPFERPAGFDLVACWERWSGEFAASRPQLPVTLRASPAALAAFGEVFGQAAGPVVEAAGPADEHGWRVVTLSFEHEVAAAHRLAGFGDQVEVLTPPTVRTTLVATARQILRRYDAADW
jgi:predicted DNA-binding transcriptional regulator YafY